MKVKDYTFKKSNTLFDEEVIMVLRNRDKKHIISIGADHANKMAKQGLDVNKNQDILIYIKTNECSN